MVAIGYEKRQIAPTVSDFREPATLFGDQPAAKPFVKKARSAVPFEHPEAHRPMSTFEKSSGHSSHQPRTGALALGLAEHIELADLAGEAAFKERSRALPAASLLKGNRVRPSDFQIEILASGVAGSSIAV